VVAGEAEAPTRHRGYLLGYADESILEIDPATLAVQNTYTVSDGSMPPNIGPYINSLALANDGFAIVTFGCNCSGLLPMYMFSTLDHSFQYVQPDSSVVAYQLQNSGAHNPPATTSLDGGTALIGGLYQLGTTVSLTPMTTASFSSQIATVTPDGKTLLVGADNGLFVQPL